MSNVTEACKVLDKDQIMTFPKKLPFTSVLIQIIFIHSFYPLRTFLCEGFKGGKENI